MMQSSVLMLGERSVEARKIGACIEMRLLENSQDAAARILISVEHLRRLQWEAVAIGPIILLSRHPTTTIFHGGSIWAQFDHWLWGQLLDSQLAGEPRIVTREDAYSDGTLGPTDVSL